MSIVCKKRILSFYQKNSFLIVDIINHVKYNTFYNKNLI